MHTRHSLLAVEHVVPGSGRLELTTLILRARFRHALIPGPVLVPLQNLRLERRHDSADTGPCVPHDGYAAVTMHAAVPTDAGWDCGQRCVCGGGAGWGMAPTHLLKFVAFMVEWQVSVRGCVIH